MGGGSTIRNSETKIEAIKLQSSAYGVTLGVVYGMTKISGNLLWYGGFKSIAHTTTQKAGKGGGGTKIQNTSYTYTAHVAMGLCEGTVLDIPRVWRGKNVYSGGALPEQINTITETFTVPERGGSYTVAQAATMRSLVSVGYRGQVDVGDGGSGWGMIYLSEGTGYTRSGGTLHFPMSTGYGDYEYLNPACGQSVQITYTTVSPGGSRNALQEVGMGLFRGDVGQAVWSTIATVAPSQSIGYSGIAYVAGSDYDLGSSAQVENHQFEVLGSLSYSVSKSTPDANPADFTADLLANGRYGARFPTSRINFDAWSAYCRAAGLLMSPGLTEQISAAEFITKIGELTLAAPVWGIDVLRMMPFCESSITGPYGVNYTPSTTPAYDLTDDHFLPLTDGGEPIEQDTRAQADSKNHIRVEFLNRANGYAPEISEAKDQADIDTFGLRSAEVIEAHWICDGQVARNVAQLLLQRSLYVRAIYRFKLPWQFALLEPMDWVTLTDAGLGLSKTPARILSVDESEEGDLDIEAEELPPGIASATAYPSQIGAGFSHDYNVVPGPVVAPMIFEAPVALAAGGTGLEVWAAVRGAELAWGGANVWVSLDGTNYRQSGTVYGGATYGALTGPAAGGALPVSVPGGALTSVSEQDAAALASLCYIGGASPEYLAFQTATLTGANAYRLGGLVRGAYGTPAATHASGDPFVAITGALAKSGALDAGLIGQAVWMKFTSFNVYGSGDEGLADVTAYPYTITGAMLRLPPATPVTGLVVTLESYGIGLRWDRHPEPDVSEYEVRLGAAWATATQVERAGGTSSRLPVRSAGSYTLWVAPVDQFGNLGPTTSETIVIAVPKVASVTASVVQGKLRLAWEPGAASFPIVGYRLSWGAVVGANAIGDVTATVWDADVSYSGARTYWVQALDAADNLGPAGSVPVQIDPPTAPLSPRADVVDNNVLLYWNAPAGGSLPVERYEVRKGASWAAGIPVGSNGNSTFTAIFESAGGIYTYWIMAFDIAGTSGPATRLPVTVNQPPDYILRNNLDLNTWGGTRSNAALIDGAIWAPVPAETWQAHFTNRSWASPLDQINAGNPLYIEPGVAAGYYEEIIDYAAALPATTITVTPSSTAIAGNVSIAPTISWKLTAGDAWTNGGAGQSAVLAASGFRFVKVRLDFTGAGGANVVRLDSINVRLAVKLKTDSGAGVASAADAGGTPVAFNVTFVDADTPMVQPGGTSPVTPVVDFVKQANPATFKVLLYDRNGARVSGPFSWTARGY